MSDSAGQENAVTITGIKPRTWKGQFTLISIGHAVNKILVYPFDYLLYPYIIWKCGLIKGAVAMTILSLFYCWVTILFYNWAKTDFLGLEMLKQVREYRGSHVFGKLFGWVLSKGDAAVFVFLSTRDPFMATIYMRKGDDAYSKMKQRDWLLLISSVVIGNAYWAIAMYLGVSLAVYVWTRFIT